VSTTYALTKYSGYCLRTQGTAIETRGTMADLAVVLGMREANGRSHSNPRMATCMPSVYAVAPHSCATRRHTRTREHTGACVHALTHELSHACSRTLKHTCIHAHAQDRSRVPPARAGRRPRVRPEQGTGTPHEYMRNKYVTRHGTAAAGTLHGGCRTR
jgi:hypothetical protein